LVKRTARVAGMATSMDGDLARKIVKLIALVSVARRAELIGGWMLEIVEAAPAMPFMFG